MDYRQVNISSDIGLVRLYEEYSTTHAIVPNEKGKQLTQTVYRIEYPSDIALGDTETVEGITFRITQISVREKTLSLTDYATVRIWQVEIKGVEVGSQLDNNIQYKQESYRTEEKNRTCYETASGTITTLAGSLIHYLTLTIWSDTNTKPDPGDVLPVPYGSYTCKTASSEKTRLDDGVVLWKISIEAVLTADMDKDTDVIFRKVTYNQEYQQATKYETQSGTGSDTGVVIQTISLQMYSSSLDDQPTPGIVFADYESYLCTASHAERVRLADGTILWQIMAEGILAAQYQPTNMFNRSESKEYTLNGSMQKTIGGVDVLLQPSGAPDDWVQNVTWVQTSDTPPVVAGDTYLGGIVQRCLMEKIEVKKPGMSDLTLWRVNLAVKGQT